MNSTGQQTQRSTDSTSSGRVKSADSKPGTAATDYASAATLPSDI